MPLRKLFFSLAATLVISLASAMSARADSVCVVGGAELTGSGSGTLANNVLTITSTNVAGGTQITINATNLPAGSFVGSLLFNTVGAPTATGTFTVANGGITCTGAGCSSINSAGLTVTVGNNNQSQPPFSTGDVLVDLPVSNAGGARLSSGETLTFTINGLFNVDLCQIGISGPGSNNPGAWSLIAHIQGLGPNNDQSGRYTCTNCISTAPIPEPTTMILLGTGLAGVAGAVRRKRNVE